MPINQRRWRLRRSPHYPDGRLQIYIEPRDLWVGAYPSPDALYIVLLPTLVFRWSRRPARPSLLDEAMFVVYLHVKWRYTTGKMTTEARNAAAAAVFRYDAWLRAQDGDDSPSSREYVAWWED